MQGRCVRFSNDLRLIKQIVNQLLEFLDTEDSMNKLSPYAHWTLRIALGSVFIYHGIIKFPNLNGLAQMMHMSVIMVFMLAVVETVGGLLVLVGGFYKDWMTRVGALLLMFPMLGAIFMVHWGQWNFMASKSHPMGGMEFQVTLLLVQLYLLIKGNSVANVTG